MADDKRPILAITSGDPGGIGAEIAVKALAVPEIYEDCRPLLIGDTRIVVDALRICHLSLGINDVGERDQLTRQSKAGNLKDERPCDNEPAAPRRSRFCELHAQSWRHIHIPHISIIIQADAQRYR